MVEVCWSSAQPDFPDQETVWTAFVRTLTQDLSDMVEPARGMHPSQHSPWDHWATQASTPRQGPAQGRSPIWLAALQIAAGASNQQSGLTVSNEFTCCPRFLYSSLAPRENVRYISCFSWRQSFSYNTCHNMQPCTGSQTDTTVPVLANLYWSTRRVSKLLF